MLCSIFEINNTAAVSSKLLTISQEVYTATDANYNATDQYVAFGEGNGYNGDFIDEWVVLPTVGTWVITAPGSTASLSVYPVVYNKIAFSYMALYNTTYAWNTLVFLEQNLPDPTNGYADGANNYWRKQLRLLEVTQMG